MLDFQKHNFSSSFKIGNCVRLHKKKWKITLFYIPESDKW